MESLQREPAEEGAVIFHFDFASPYAYLASTQMDGLAERTGRRIIWRPMMLGAAMKLTGAQPLVLMPMRGGYARRDLKRFAAFLDVPFEMPPRMPIRSLAPGRAFLPGGRRTVLGCRPSSSSRTMAAGRLIS